MARGPKAILIIPTEEHRERLLGSEVGCYPPTAYREGGEWKILEYPYHPDMLACREPGVEIALVVWWDSKTVRMGCHRLADAIYFATDEFYREMWGDQYDGGRLGLTEVRDLARWACSKELLWDYEQDDPVPLGGLGTLVEVKG